MFPLASTQAQTFHLDLKAASSDGAIVPISSRSFSGDKPVELALEIKIENIWPLSIKQEDEVEVDLLVRNLGKEPVAIPASRQYAEALAPGNLDRRKLAVGLKVSLPKEIPSETRFVFEYCTGATGSASVPGSMIVLQQNDTVLIHTACRLFSESQVWPEKDGIRVAKVSVQATVLEDFILDEELTIPRSSAKYVSDNAIDVTLSWRR